MRCPASQLAHLASIVFYILPSPVSSVPTQIRFDGAVKHDLDVDALQSGYHTQPLKQGPFNPLHHLSGISPYHSAGVRKEPPDNCKVISAVYLVRHSSIAANDDEFDETMQPFVAKLKQYLSTKPDVQDAAFAFLSAWESPVTSKNVEELTESGVADARAFGERLALLYPHLLPNNTAKFDIWAADSPRDVGSAKGLVKGLLPKHEGGDGTGDGHVRLVRVGLTSKAWGASLTPHKICQKFSKKSGKAERNMWENVYTGPIIERLKSVLPGFNLTRNDIVAMQQFCGYETVLSGSSPFCNAFTEEEWLGFEYANDLWYQHLLGYSSNVGPYLGFPFLKSASHQLWHPTDTSILKKKKGKLPLPREPPSIPLDQNLFIYLTHRQEPPALLTTLGLYNDTETLPTDHIKIDRKWRTSRIIPFLGHVALERLQCDADGDYVRVLVNEQQANLPHCHYGYDGMCPTEDFKKLVDEKEALYGDFEAACGKVIL